MVSTNDWVRYPMRYLKPGTYIITKYSKPVWEVTVKPYEPKTATFNGLHNRTKVRILLALYDRQRRGQPGVSLGERVRLIPVGYDSLKVTLSKLSRPRWDYILKKPGKNEAGRPVMLYSIAARGVRFLRDRTPAEVIAEVAAEIRAYRSVQVQNNSLK